MPSIPKQNEQRTVPQKSSTDGSNTRSQSIKKENKADKSPSGAQLPGIATSKIDVNAKPVYEPAGKPITEVNIDDGMYIPFDP